MRLEILGPLTITDDVGSPFDIKLEPKQEIVLVALAANADRGVPVRELVLAVHGTTEMALYKRSIESLVSRLRSSLRTIGPGGPVIPPARRGVYSSDVPEESIDALRFLREAERLLNNWAAVASDERQTLSGGPAARPRCALGATPCRIAASSPRRSRRGSGVP